VLIVRGVLALAMVLCGMVVMARMLAMLPAGLAVLPGVVLAAAMIALGAHRLFLIARAWRST